MLVTSPFWLFHLHITTVLALTPTVIFSCFIPRAGFSCFRYIVHGVLCSLILILLPYVLSDEGCQFSSLYSFDVLYIAGSD